MYRFSCKTCFKTLYFLEGNKNIIINGKDNTYINSTFILISKTNS
jgi:hypothetical protein